VELTNEFRVGVPIEQAWDVLTDVERIAPCLPGAQLQEIEGDEHRGIVKVKVGPITAQYKGAATFVERDAPRRAVLRAEGRETRGQGGANATITATLEPDGDGTKVTVTTDLTVTGKVAQFGRGVLADVSAKLLGQFVDCLESTVLADKAAGPFEPGGVAPTEPDTTMEPPAAEEPAAAVPQWPSNGNGSPEPVAASAPSAARRIDSPEAKPVDLMGAAGAPMAKRVAPAAAALALLWLVRLFLKRRRR
jgi:carbon monoxide dehydrogenase subunit G